MSPLTKYVVRNLLARPFIASLVLSAMVATGGTVAGVGGIGDGMRRAFATRGHENWVLVMSHDSFSEAQSALPLTTLQRVTAQKEVTRFSPEVVVVPVVRKVDGGTTAITLRALDPVGFELHGTDIIEGRAPRPAAAEMMVGEDLRKHFPWLTVGATLSVLNEQLTCVGIFRSAGFLSGEVWTTRALILADPRRTPTSVVYIETRSAGDATALVERLKTDRAIAVEAMTEPEAQKRRRGDQGTIVDAMLLIFVLVVGGAFFAASSFLSLLQRHRLAEFCMMRALGFRSGVITALIVIETEGLALVGGLVGILVAAAGLQNYSFQSISQNASSVTFNVKLRWEVAALALVVMLVVGFFAAVPPAIRARRTNITSGLRDE